METIIILHSYHHNNTRKVAEAIVDVVGGIIRSPLEIDKMELTKYNLIGFGSGIDSGKHYEELLDFAKKLIYVADRKCFVF